MQYRVNGKIYDDYEEAKKAEEKFLEEQKEAAKREAECDKRRKEVMDAYNNYVDLFKKFKEDYPNQRRVYSNLDEFIDSLFFNKGEM